MSEEKDKSIKYREIGDRMKDIRHALGRNQRQLAVALDMPASNLSELENGKASPGYAFLLKISTRFNVSLDYLFHGAGEMFLSKEKENPLGGDVILKRLKTYDDLKWFLEHSPLLQNFIIHAAAKYRYENETLIKKDIKESLKTDQEL